MSGTVEVLSGNALTQHFHFSFFPAAEQRGVLESKEAHRTSNYTQLRAGAAAMCTEGINFHYQQMEISVSR